MAILNPHHTWTPVFGFFEKNFKGQFPDYQAASLGALGMISDGCCDLMKHRLHNFLPTVIEALKSEEEMIKLSAWYALGEFAEHVHPDLEGYFSCILGAFIADASVEVKVNIGKQIFA